MWVEKDFIVRISPKLGATEKVSSAAAIWLSSFDRKRLILSDNFQPDPELLLRHENKCLDAIAASG
jgi:hypothetical protein